MILNSLWRAPTSLTSHTNFLGYSRKETALMLNAPQVAVSRKTVALPSPGPLKPYHSLLIKSNRTMASMMPKLSANPQTISQPITGMTAAINSCRIRAFQGVTVDDIKRLFKCHDNIVMMKRDDHYLGLAQWTNGFYMLAQDRVTHCLYAIKFNKLSKYEIFSITSFY